MNPPPVVPTVRPLSTSAAAKLDAAGNVAVDVACRRCGYNLRTLPSVGKCPECGTAVGRSLHGDLLQFSDPEWVEKLAGGMNWILISIIVSALGGIMLVVVGTILSAMNSRTMYLVAYPFLQLGLGAIGLIGYWKATTPDPASLETDGKATARKVVRVTQVLRYAMAPIVSISMFASSPLLAEGVRAVVGIFGIVGVFAVFIYAKQLAVRVPDDKLARHCRIVMWGMAVTLVTSLLFQLITAFGTRGFAAPAPTAAGGSLSATAPDGDPATSSSLGVTSSSSAMGAGSPSASIAVGPVAPVGIGGLAGTAAVGCVFGGGFLVFGIWSLILLIHFRRALVTAAQTARVTWAAPHGPAVVPVPAPPRPLT